MITLTPAQVLAIRQHGETDFPHECCGILIGAFGENGAKQVMEVLPISNAREEEAKRNRFLITAEEMMRGEKLAREQGLDVVGFYHSHPDHPAKPSQFDLDHAWPIYSYIIVSVMAGKSADFTSWELDPDRSEFEAEEIVEKGGE